MDVCNDGQCSSVCNNNNCFVLCCLKYLLVVLSIAIHTVTNDEEMQMLMS